MTYKKDIENTIHGIYGRRGIAGLVELIQLNYNMRNVIALVSAEGSEVTIDLRSPDLVEGYRALKKTVEFPLEFNAYADAKAQLASIKKNISESTYQTNQDRSMFMAAKVSRINFSIGGDIVVVKDTGF